MSRRSKGYAYAGRGVPELRATPGDVIHLPPPKYATIVPDPIAKHDEIRERYVRVNGAIDATAKRPQPRLTIRDAKNIANHLTLALRNDLPKVDPHDAAVIWEKWRKHVVSLRDMMSDLADDDQALAVGITLDQRTLNIHDDVAEALRHPGKVFSRYCPWRDDWATFERIHPGKVL